MHRNLRRPSTIAAGALVAVAVAAGSLVLLVPGVVGLGGGHAGEQVADPDTDTVDEDLASATAELHAHLNWLIWSDDGRVAPPAAEFVVLADQTIERATAEGEEEVADLVRAGRDALLRDEGRLRAHDLLEQAETIATGGDLEGEHRYESDVDPERD